MVPQLTLGTKLSRRQDGVEVREAGAGSEGWKKQRGQEGGCCASRQINKDLGQGEEATRK